MATQTGTAANYLDLLVQLDKFLRGYGTAGTPAKTGTGNGTMTGVQTYPGTVTETITVKCAYMPAPTQNASSTATTGGSLVAGTYYYKVTALNAVGETIASNEISQATTGTTSTVTINWATVTGATSYRVYRGTSAGAENVYYAVSGGATATFTDTGAANTAGSPPASNGTGSVGAEIWTVSGSVTGALANATTGAAYTSAKIGFTISAGATNWANGDQWTIATTQNGLSAANTVWTQLAYNGTSYTAGIDTVTAEYYWKAPGLSGSEAIYLNTRAYYNTTNDYYNIELRGAQGYQSTANFVSQPGISPASYVLLWNQSMPYWFIANGQRVIVFAKVSTVYESLYMGKFLPYGTPSQYPYPVLIGGTCDGMDYRFSDTSYHHLSFWDPTNLQLCYIDNTWITVQNWGNSGQQPQVNNVWPWVYGGSSRMTWGSQLLNGGYGIFPARIESNSPANNIFGELDGVGFVTGNSNSSESTINDGTNTWTVFQNVFRTAADNYVAIKMV